MKLIVQEGGALAEALTVRRHYIQPDGSFDPRHACSYITLALITLALILVIFLVSCNPNCNPRYLLFEYAFDIILRARQVEMVSSSRPISDTTL